MADVKEVKKEYRRSKEIAGVVLLALAVFLVVCLVSYHPGDPSFTHRPDKLHRIANYGGFVGSYLSDSFLRLFGISSYLFPLLLVVLAFNFFRNRVFSVNLAVTLGFGGLIVSTASLLSERYATRSFFYDTLDPGGLLGYHTAKILNSYINAVGAHIVLTVILLISLMVTLDVSLVSLSKRLVAVSAAAISRTSTFFLIRMERLRRKKKPPQPKKKKIGREPPPVIVEEAVPREKVSEKKRYRQTAFEFLGTGDTFEVPPLKLLDEIERQSKAVNKESLIMNARILEKKLADFGVEGKVVEVKPGPVITMFELEPAAGVKINKVTNLSDDLAMALKAQNIRIIAPIPGKSVIGVELPNPGRELVHLRDVIDNDEFLETKIKLPIALGKDIVGNPVITDLAKMPHLLIAGTTGSGKSVCLNAMICSILFKATPQAVKFLMIDPKRLELSAYEGIPHLLHPVVVNPKKASHVLKWAVEEMERRYRVIGESGFKNIESYNRFVDKGQAVPVVQKETGTGEGEPGEETPPPERLPYIVIVIDELADLMMVAQRNVEESLTRLAQMARAAGIHLIIATQRPSVDVITGIIKANFPTRISFQVSSKVDSRTILDQLGAEKLLGMGDMLFIPPGISKLTRIHGAYVSDAEIGRIVEFIRAQQTPAYDESIAEYNPEVRDERFGDEEFDEKYDEAVELVTDLGQASISLVQRYLKIGYNRAARIIEKMEAEGIVGPSDGAKPRKVLAGKLPE
ncbi:MAG: DNA translocase FtsK 4TM domain-containing protein [Deltaproteobacteria bacterium]|nr:DNA translocase FtsK 4TM domain-containing protein [Deltaproteobacteria bacterium]